MPRPILLSNSQLHIGLDAHGQVQDFYYPYVGQENHTAGTHLLHKIGVYVEDKLHWLDDGSWRVDPDYYGDVLISRIVATNETLGVRLEFDDCVDSEFTAFLRNVHVVNMAPQQRLIKVFFQQAFMISDSPASDTAQFIPELGGVMHYKGHRAFLVSGAHADGRPFDAHTISQYDTDESERTIHDASDGLLIRNDAEHGRVESILGFDVEIRGNSSARVHYWVAAGRSEREVKKIDEKIRHDGLLHHVLKTANWWADWVKPTKMIAAKLPQEYRRSFIRSALIIKAQADKRGAVIASTDSTTLSYDRDSYAYCWPRQAAYGLWPLLRLGYTDELLAFFSFARRSLHDDGYLGHKYLADGSPGPSWHAYEHYNGVVTPPIQSDETALTLFLFGQYYRQHPEAELLGSFYRTLLVPMANFLSGYVDDEGLPLPSNDIWEEKYLSTTYTAAVTYASLIEAAYLAEAAGDPESARRWAAAAERLYAKRNLFYNDKRHYFYKGFTKRDATINFDDTIDSSSLYGVIMFGYFDMNDAKVQQAYATLQDTLMTVGSKVTRYEHDAYRRQDGEHSNPWPLTTLWAAQYALQQDDYVTARTALNWVRAVMEKSGAIAEQYNNDDHGLSVSPFVWSQAEYMNVLLDMITETDVS